MKDLHPASTIFLAISIPRPDAPDKKIEEVAYFATASIPSAPIYHDHRSLTSSF